MSYSRGVDPRAAVALALMSLGLLSVLRRGGALRSFQLPAALGRLQHGGRSLGGAGTARKRLSGSERRSSSGSGDVGPEGSTVPDTVHLVVGADELKGEVIVVGDVHGCHNEMVTLLKRCGYRLGNEEDKNRFTVILAGDLVNKGPKNAAVVRTAREEGFLAIRGNHDNFALSAANGTGRFAKNPAPRPNGGPNGDKGAAPPKAPAWVSQLSREDSEWLEALPYSIRLPSLGCLVVHAGFVPGVPLESQSLEAMTTMRNVKEGENGYEPIAYTSEGIAWAKAWRGPEHVYFGHDAKRGFQKEAFATGLDTGCVYGRSLTAAILPSGRIVCVPAESEWAPT